MSAVPEPDAGSIFACKFIGGCIRSEARTAGPQRGEHPRRALRSRGRSRGGPVSCRRDGQGSATWAGVEGRPLNDGGRVRVLQRSIARQHALCNSIAFDEPMVERARDMERNDHTDQNPADEMPDDDAV